MKHTKAEIFTHNLGLKHTHFFTADFETKKIEELLNQFAIEICERLLDQSHEGYNLSSGSYYKKSSVDDWVIKDMIAELKEDNNKYEEDGE